MWCSDETPLGITDLSDCEASSPSRAHSMAPRSIMRP